MSEKYSSISECPICSSPAQFLYKVEGSFLRRHLESYYNEAFPKGIDIVNYNLLRCINCSLEFASPLISGSYSFYQWITQHSNYYPKIRWEWLIVLDKLKSSSKDLSVLEVGCGAGDFLQLVNQLPNIRAVGLDMTASSIKECKDRGLEAYCETINLFLCSQEFQSVRFDAVVSFHCLEHVEDPKGFVQSMSSALKPEGSIFISTPYSPMSFEGTWFDPLNHPPHHMTRWNVRSYQELANQLNLKIQVSMPLAGRKIDRTLSTLNYAWNGPAHVVSHRRMQLAALKRPVATFREWLRQQQRERVNGQVAADVVLVELTF